MRCTTRCALHPAPVVAPDTLSIGPFVAHEANHAGSDPLIVLGSLVNTHGIRGELRLLLFNPASSTLRPGLEVVLRRHQTCSPRRITAIRPHKRFQLLTLEGCASMAAAEALVGSEICVQLTDLPATGPDEIYHYELLGMKVETTDGIELGTIAEMLPTAQHDICVVRSAEREHLVPLVTEIVQTIDRTRRVVIITPIPGLVES